MESTAKDLIEEIARNLNIYQVGGETRASWSARVIYSAVGNLAYNCLWNYDDSVVETFGAQAHLKTSDENRGVSVVYWTRFVRKAFYAYCSLCSRDVQLLFPEKFDELLNGVSVVDAYEPIEDEQNDFNDAKANADLGWNELIEEMTELYVHTGCFLHRPHWLAPSYSRSVISGDVVFARGMFWNGFVAGLGNWRHTTSDKTDVDSLDVLGLQKQTFSSLYEEIQSAFKPENVVLSSQAEYLRVKPEYGKWGSYWTSQPTYDGEISLGRYGNLGTQRYFLYRATSKSGIERQLLPEWRVNPDWSRQKYGSREYVRIALALLSRRGTTPRTTTKVGETLVKINLGYLLPPEEEAFFKLYSWPTNFKQVGENWERVTVPPVYRVLKKHWEQLGLEIEEINA